MSKPTIILATSNGVGMGHLARASAVAQALKEVAHPIIVSMSSGIAEIPSFMGIRCEYIPGKDRMWMTRDKWDVYVRDRLVALIEETNAKVLSFDGVVPYPGVIATREIKKDLDLVWIRRGLWQKNLLRFILPAKSRLMSLVIEPGDFAKSYDSGPTSGRKDAVLTSPVSLFDKEKAMTRDQARQTLGIDINRPTVLVQLGTGDRDVNEKMHAALSGLLGWKDVQVILTKAPIDKDGNSLAPAGLDIKVIRYFPLAQVLRAFDASICATGYNGVHELLPAQVPTVFVSNIRGTDDQEARARWCNDFGYALRANQANLEDITQKVKMLQDPAVRKALSDKCAALPDASGGREIAEILVNLAAEHRNTQDNSITSIFFLPIHYMNRALRLLVNHGLRRIALVYRLFNPHVKIQDISQEAPIFGDQTEAAELAPIIKSSTRFEHLIAGASENYRKRRQEIAFTAYGKLVETHTIK